MKDKNLFWILAAALMLRLGCFLSISVLNPGGFAGYDAQTYYLPIAKSLSEKGVFGIEYDGRMVVNHHRVPVYPLFLALFLYLGAHPAAITFIQVLISCVTCWLTYRTSVVLSGNRRSALIAATLVGVDVPSIFYSNLLLSETLFTFLMLSSVYFLARYLKSEGERPLYISALFAGLSVLCRPAGLLLPAAGALLVLLEGRRIIPALKFAATGMAVAGLWVIRNQLVFGHVFLTTIGNTNMLYYRAAGVLAAKEKTPISEVQARLFEEVKDEYADLKRDPILLSRMEATRGREIIIRHPWYFIRNMAQGAVYLALKPMRAQADRVLKLRPYSDLTEWGRQHGLSLWERLMKHTSLFTVVLVAVQVVFLLLLWSGFLSGALIAFRRDRLMFWFTGFILASYFLIASGPEADARFRIPVVPVAALLAGMGLNSWFSAEKKRQTP